MNWAMLIASIAQMITALVPAVEKIAHPDASGEEKKQAVMTGVQTVVNGMIGISKGGQADTWNKISQISGPVVDAAVSVMNAVNPKEEKK